MERSRDDVFCENFRERRVLLFECLAFIVLERILGRQEKASNGIMLSKSVERDKCLLSFKKALSTLKKNQMLSMLLGT